MSTGPDRPDTTDAVEVVESTPEAIRERARQQIGLTGRSETSEPLRKILRRNGLTFYPVAALGVLSIVDVFQDRAFTVLGPEMSRALGLSIAGIAGIRTLSFLAGTLAPMPMAALVQGRARRAFIAVLTGLGWSLLTLMTGFVVNAVGLLLVLVADGLTTGSVSAIHQSLLLDTYPPEGRVRALSAYFAIATSASIISPLLVAILAGPLNLTWRGVFIGLGLVSTAGTLFALRLRDPGYGHWDTDRIRETVHEVRGDEDAPVSSKDVSLGFFEILRRIQLIPTVRRLMAGILVLGILLVPYSTFLSFFLDRKWGLDASGRGLFFSFLAAVAIVGLLLYGRRAESAFRENPAKVLRFAGWALVAALVLVAAGALAPVFGVMVALFAVGQTLIVLVSPSIIIALLSVVPALHRPHVNALFGIFQAAGSLLGIFFLSGVENRFGLSGAIVALVIPGIAGALVISSARKFVVPDIDHMIDEVAEEEQIATLRSEGRHLPMLACRSVDFSYGQLQVLFGVDFTVDDGEMVSLLGVNGAGKSTLLKVVSGIGLPSKGSVRFRGEDITYLDAERRLKLGITQVPGGRAVFGRMTVVDNMRVFGYSLGRDRPMVDAAIDRCFEVFPALAERRSSLAGTLSGGEQQMLGLSKALILKPQLLLIDELSLGLAPVIVGQLLEMVREINTLGTAVVLVEQSVNIALSVTEHAYFMERGEIRFDGPSDELLDRGDLLRAVFLPASAEAATL